MPINMPEDSLITVQKRELPFDYKMPQMEMAEKHYSIGYIITGDRRIITPYQQFDIHSGDVTAVPPHLYHRTFSVSNVPYVNYLIKISGSIADDFCSDIGEGIWNDIFDKKVLPFAEGDRLKIETLLEDMLLVYSETAEYTDQLLKGMLYRLMVFIWKNNNGNVGERFKSKLSAPVMDAMYYIEQNYKEDITLRDISVVAGFSEGHFSRLFKAQVGVSFSGYIVNTRIRHVKEMLVNTGLSISEIAIRTGFSNGDYLATCFYRTEGMTPSAYRRSFSPG